MKSKLVSTLCIMLLSSVLIGCTATSPTATSPTAGQPPAAEGLSGRLTVLTNRTDLVDNVFQEYVAQFNAIHPDVEVIFEAITNYENDVAIRLGTREYGDVLLIPNSLPNNEFGYFFEPLGTVADMSQRYDFITAKIHDGIVYGIPASANANGIVYNKRIFAEAGITELPKTPDEFLAALRLIQENTDAIPYYTNFAAGWPLTQWQDHAWGSVTGDPDYQNNIMVRQRDPFAPGTSNYIVNRLMYDIVAMNLNEADPVTTDWEQSKVMMNNGEIATMVLGSWAISQMQEAGPNADDIGYMAFPFNINGRQFATASADYCYAINIHSNNKEAARAWIDFMVHDSGFALSQGSISAVKGSELPATLADFRGIEYVVSNPATPENEGRFDELSNESEIGLYAEPEKRRIVEAAMGSRNESFDDIMNDWNVRWNRVLDQMD